ncbi:hypothetical protein EJ110_NYTH51801 [Nymphaea thermarum]|nr:hypothetical protein EJ110_NYTH51801 [Nymphaea thermarum]
MALKNVQVNDASSLSVIWDAQALNLNAVECGSPSSAAIFGATEKVNIPVPKAFITLEGLGAVVTLVKWGATAQTL